MVGCDAYRMSPMNSCVAFCRRYMQAASTASYSPKDFGLPVGLFHGSQSTSFTRRTSSCIWVKVRPVVRWQRNGSPGLENSLVGTLKFSQEGRYFLTSPCGVSWNL